MTDTVLAIIVGIICLVIGILAGYIIRKTLGEKTIGGAEQTAKNLILDAENKAENIKKEIALKAKEDALKYKDEAEKEIKSRSNFNYSLEVSGNDKILTLSSCFGDSSKRVVIHAKLIENE